MSLIEYIGSLGGIVGVFGFLIFLAYRSTVTQMRQDRVFMEDRLTKVIENYNLVCQNNQKVMVEHTQVLTELIAYLRGKNGNH